MKTIDFKTLTSEQLNHELNLLRGTETVISFYNATMKDADLISDLGFSVSLPYPYKKLKTMDIRVCSSWSYEYHLQLKNKKSV